MQHFGLQSLGVAVVLVCTFVGSGLIARLVRRVMGFRIDEEHEVNGIDLVIHVEAAYDHHSTAGARTGGTQAPKATSGPFGPPGRQD